MQSSSDAFAAELLSGGRYASRVVVMSGDKVVEDTFYNGTRLGLISDSSSVRYERTADTRSTAEVSFAVLQDGAESLLDPVAFPELAIYNGLWVNGDYEWIQMGVFGIYNLLLSRDRGKGVTASCSAADRSGRVRDNPWKAPFSVAAGTDYYTAIKAVIDDRARGFTAVYNLGSSALTTPDMKFSDGEDPWAAVLKLAEGVGAEAYFDRQGAVAVFPVADPLTTAPSLVLQATSSGVQIVPATREFSNREVYNGVICRGEAPWLLFPVSGEIWDEDPLSPSYRLGPFGEKPKIIGDALATTDAQCLTAATAEFKKISGVVEQINFVTLKDPRLEVGDIIDQIDEYLNINGRYVLESYSYPLGRGSASGLVRRKR